MAKSKVAPRDTQSPPATVLALRSKDSTGGKRAKYVHLYEQHQKRHVCMTESRGFSTPHDRSPAELVLDATDGFIPLWDQQVTLRWKFDAGSLSVFSDPDQVANHVRTVFADAILAWGDAAPVKFSEAPDNWDFEITVLSKDQCNINGCVLASAFFPDQGRHKLFVYPKMLEQTRQEQVDTLTHESGHIFGLRHFFAQKLEKPWPSVLFGEQPKFTIMNYGAESVLTETDKSDLKRLYQGVWSGQLKDINGTPIRLVRPYHELVNATPAPVQAVSKAASVCYFDRLPRPL